MSDRLSARPRLNKGAFVALSLTLSLVPGALFWVGLSRDQAGMALLGAVLELGLVGALGYGVLATQATWIVLTPNAIRWSVRGREGESGWDRLAGIQPMLAHQYRVITADGHVDVFMAWEGVETVLGSLQAGQLDPAARFDRALAEERAVIRVR